ncbi:MAG: molybdopterin dinucleotide binding domain-containing protein, partial [Myxococcota bacterium]
RALVSGRPYRLDTLLLYYANPCYAWMNPERWTHALDAVPFIATCTPFMDETATAVADLILPDHTYLERWEDAAPAPSSGAPVFGIRQPVVAPLHDTRASGDVVIEIAKKLGGRCAEAFPWKDFRSALLARAVGIQAARRGSINETSPKKFFRRLVKQGFWSDPEYPFEAWSEAFETPTRKFEFFSLRLWHTLQGFAEQAGRSPAQVVAGWNHEEDPDLVCMPRHTALAWAGTEAEYPLLLDPYRRGTYAVGGGANLPLLQDLVTEHGGSRWETTAALHPSSAEPLGIRDGDRIAVESPAGRVEVPVHVDIGVRPGTLHFPQGGGHTAFGRFAKGRGANVMELLVPAFDPLAGFAALTGTRVRARRIPS